MSRAQSTLTPDLSKRARRELALSQNDVINATGIQAYKLKQWEGRGLTIELADIRKLSDFYESQGVNLAELADHISRSAGAGREGLATEANDARPALQDGFTYTPRPGFIISDLLGSDVVDLLMERMEANDERIAGLTSEAFKTGLFGDITEGTEAKARELIGTLAENHVIFRSLQGRNVVSTLRDEPKTIGEFLAKMLQGSPVLSLLAANDGNPKAKARIKPEAVTTDAKE
jgi:hypothetical protein